MDAQQALADLTEISSQIEAAVLFSADGSVEGSTLADEAKARNLANAAEAVHVYHDLLAKKEEDDDGVAKEEDRCVVARP